MPCSMRIGARGARRWSGIRSETLEVDGSRVHLLRADAGPGAPQDAPTQLLVHGAAGSSTVWLDAIQRLASVGPGVAPDLPGSIFGETATSRARQAGPEASVVFLDRLTRHARPGPSGSARPVMGGMAGLLFAAEHGRVERLVWSTRCSPPRWEALNGFAWQTLGRLVLTVGLAVMRVLVRLWSVAQLRPARRPQAPQADGEPSVRLNRPAGSS